MAHPQEQQPAKVKQMRREISRPLSLILDDLQKDVPKRVLAQKRLGGNNITYIPWHKVARLMDFYAPGWEYEVTDRTITQTHIILTVRVFINCAEGRFYREATGLEKLDTKGFGDPSSNAESMAFRRACAKWGLGLSLYEKEG